MISLDSLGYLCLCSVVVSLYAPVTVLLYLFTLAGQSKVRGQFPKLHDLLHAFKVLFNAIVSFLV